MKKGKWLLVTAAVSVLSMASVTQAAILGQAGDIVVGKPYELNATSGIASYYKDGNSGNVTFSCMLTGDNAKALLYPGKNFNGNPIAMLEADTINGPYEWTLTDQGESSGNIKIQLVQGKTATVQCKEEV